MIAQALAELPNECCGLLAGRVDAGIAQVVRQFPLVNEVASPTRYRAELRSLCAAHRECRDSGLEFVAIYHSHPATEPVPSRTDLAEFYWDGLMSLILSLVGERPVVRGWWLSAEGYREGEWEIVEEPVSDGVM
jgi:proteasome lid subunit RPN8/RPN11